MKNEFNASAINQSSMMYAVEKHDTMMLSMDQDKAISYPPIDFIITNEFNEMVEHKACLFLVLPKVLQELMEEFLFLKHYQNSRQIISTQARMMWKVRIQFYVDSVLFNFNSQLYFYYWYVGFYFRYY